MTEYEVNEFFGLERSPFTIAPDPSLVYWSQYHREALANLERSIEESRGIVLFSGEVGTGKTTIIRRLMSEFSDTTQYALILNPFIDDEALLQQICVELSITLPDEPQSSMNLFNLIHQHLLSNFEAGKRSVLIIDEAQHLSFKTMEQLRLLTNLETDSQKLLVIIFVGQPELRQLIQQPKLRQLAQRITYRPHLAALTKQETAEYINCRFHMAGAKEVRKLIEKRAIKQCFEISKGIPRAINVVMERALSIAYVEKAPKIIKRHIEQAQREVVGWDTEQPQRSRWLSTAASISGAVAIGLFAASWFFSEKLSNSLQDVLATTPQVTELTEASTPDNTQTLLSIDDLQVIQRQKLGRIDYQAHVYSDETQQGFVFINGKRLGIGEFIGPAQIQVIDSEGIILMADGIEFRLAALRSWPEA